MSSESGDRAKAILRAAMIRHGVTYEVLAERLGVAGKDPAGYLRKKVSGGGFSAAFFLDCLAAIGATEIKLD